MKKINGDLTFDEMSSVMSEILNGKNDDDAIAEFLKDLSNVKFPLIFFMIFYLFYKICKYF